MSESEGRSLPTLIYSKAKHTAFVLCLFALILLPYIPLVNLSPLIFDLMTFGWLHSIMLISIPIPLFLMEISFLIYTFSFYAHFFRNTTGAHNKGLAYILYTLYDEM